MSDDRSTRRIVTDQLRTDGSTVRTIHGDTPEQIYDDTLAEVRSLSAAGLLVSSYSALDGRIVFRTVGG